MFGSNSDTKCCFFSVHKNVKDVASGYESVENEKRIGSSAVHSSHKQKEYTLMAARPNSIACVSSTHGFN